ISKETWITVIDLSILFFVLLSLRALGRFLHPILVAMFSFNQSNRLLYERNVIVNRLGSVLNILFFLEFSFLLTLVSDYYGIRIMSFHLWQHFFLYLGILLFAFFLKRALNQIIGYILDISDTIFEYRFQSNLYLKFVSLLVFPFVLILPYIPNNIIEPVFQSIIFILILSYLLRLERLIRVTTHKRFSIFYLFLYLCIVEFGPAILIMAYQTR
ncbi:MAG TPA: DUF4271 domain-containing protein, partial [Salinivirgaceae bacterium]|nr:DUF4271 domain-containing protein [Salinivirgaceae bacterium]